MTFGRDDYLRETPPPPLRTPHFPWWLATKTAAIADIFLYIMLSPLMDRERVSKWDLMCACLLSLDVCPQAEFERGQPSLSNSRKFARWRDRNNSYNVRCFHGSRLISLKAFPPQKVANKILSEMIDSDILIKMSTLHDCNFFVVFFFYWRLLLLQQLQQKQQQLKLCNQEPINIELSSRRRLNSFI